MSSKRETIILVGMIMVMLASLINVITISFFQNASAFSLQGTFDKLFGGLFHKSSPKQTQQQPQPQQQQQQTNTNNSSISTSSSRAMSSSLTIPAACHIVNGGLSDPKCTPGAINPSVTQ
jgi:flagellar basal body-associated protein FliL